MCRIWLETVKYKPSSSSHKHAVRRQTSTDANTTFTEDSANTPANTDADVNEVDEEKVNNFLCTLQLFLSEMCYKREFALK